jgi:hypothetical protein
VVLRSTYTCHKDLKELKDLFHEDLGPQHTIVKRVHNFKTYIRPQIISRRSI